MHCKQLRLDINISAFNLIQHWSCVDHSITCCLRASQISQAVVVNNKIPFLYRLDRLADTASITPTAAMLDVSCKRKIGFYLLNIILTIFKWLSLYLFANSLRADQNKSIRYITSYTFAEKMSLSVDY